MRKMLALTGAVFGLLLSANFAAPAQAGETAERCGEYGCDQIHCHDFGNQCVRYSDYDSYYNGYVGGGYGYGDGYGSDYGGYYGGYGDQAYDGGAYGGYGDGYGGGDGYGNYGAGYYGGYGNGMHMVCDSDGTRCYQTTAPYWNYRDYYRVHGYHWEN